MADALTGWATISGTGSDLFIRRTTDGGGTWQPVSPPGVPAGFISGTHFLGTSDVWITVTVRRETEIIFHSADGGVTWQCSAPIQFGGSMLRSQMTFIDPQHGWFLVDYGVTGNAQAVAIFITEDGGMHWAGRSLTAPEPTQATVESLPYPCMKTGITFHDALTGWATGNCATGELLYMTHTGGWTWQRLPLDTLDPSLPPIGSGVHISPPKFSSAANGVFLAQGAGGVRLYITRDTGVTWQGRLLPVSPDHRPDFINADDGWYTANNLLYVTHDGGRRWETIMPTVDTTAAPGPPPSFTNVVLSFVDANLGFAGEPFFPALLKTTDGGRTWVRMRL